MDTDPGRPRVAETPGPSTGRWLSAKEVAIEYGIGRQWVYENKAKIGYTKMGDGRAAQVRFDRDDVERFMRARYHAPHGRPSPSRKLSRPRRIYTSIRS
jgi:hypothetical protein